MPRKTKKQKILARLHRLQLQTVRTEDEGSEIVTTPDTKPGESQLSLADSEPKVATQPKAKAITYSYSHVYSDVKKILILSALALGVEVVLSLTASNGYAKLALPILNLVF